MSTLQESRFDRLLPLKSIGDERGMLVAVENGPDLPFAIERLFYIVGAGEAPRGLHAHRELHELLICAAGSCEVITDDGAKRTTYTLDRRDVGLHLAPMTWIETGAFTPDCVLLVLASAPFEEADYIRDYSSFLAAAAERAAL